MANLLNLKINLKLNGNAINIDSGNMTQTELINAIKDIDPNLMQYLTGNQIASIPTESLENLTDTQLGSISVDNNIDKLNWGELSNESKASILDFIVAPQESQLAPLAKQNYNMVNFDEMTSGATPVTINDSNIEYIIGKFKNQYNAEEIDTTVNKLFLYSKDAILALTYACTDADAEGIITLNDISGIRDIDDDPNSDGTLAYAFSQGLIESDVERLFAKAGITVYFDTLAGNNPFIKDNSVYKRVGDLLVQFR